MSQVVLDRPYTLLKVVGKGSFGKVYKALDNKTQKVVAIKELELESDDDDNIEEMQQEISLLCTCDSMFITRYYGSCLMGMKLWIIMDYCGVGSIRHLMKSGPLEEKHISVICSDVLNALVYLHRNNIIHRDIKAANILMTEEGIVKLCDFGVAGQVTRLSMNNLKRNSFVGTPYWMAPEVIKRSGYDVKADIWSFGITVYEMAVGHPPYVELEPMKAVMKIPRGDPPTLEGNFSKILKEFVSLALQKEPGQRPSAEELLKHKFVKNARKTNKELLDLVARHQKWSEMHQLRNEQLPEEFSDPRQVKQGGATVDGWIFETIKASQSNSKGDLGTVKSSITSKSKETLTNREKPPSTKDLTTSSSRFAGVDTKDSGTVKKSTPGASITTEEIVPDIYAAIESLDIRGVESSFDALRDPDMATIKESEPLRKVNNDSRPISRMNSLPTLTKKAASPPPKQQQDHGEEEEDDDEGSLNDSLFPPLSLSEVSKLKPSLSTLLNIPFQPLHLDPRTQSSKLSTNLLQHIQETIVLMDHLKTALDALPL